MRPKISLIVGLPGSGKTHMAEKMSGVLLDDITDISDLPKSSELGDQNLIITDVNFCDSRILKVAVAHLKNLYSDHKVEIIFFENNENVCRKNVEHRNDGRNVEGTIRRFSAIYAPPIDAHKIWNSSNIKDLE